MARWKNWRNMKCNHFRIYEVILDGKTAWYEIERPGTGYSYPNVNIYSVAFTDGPIPFIPYDAIWLAETYLNLHDKEYNIREKILVYEETVYE